MAVMVTGPLLRSTAPKAVGRWILRNTSWLSFGRVVRIFGLWRAMHHLPGR
jgi:hypothetical protein